MNFFIQLYYPDGQPTHSIHLAVDEAVNITSPSYPGGLVFTWVITTETGWKLRITTLSFDSDEDSDVFLAGEGVDFTGESFLRWSGSKTPPVYRSVGNEMWISFKFYYHVPTLRNGFALTVKSIPQSGTEESCSSISKGVTACYSDTPYVPMMLIHTYVLTTLCSDTPTLYNDEHVCSNTTPCGIAVFSLGSFKSV